MKKIPWWNVTLDGHRLLQFSKKCIESKSFSMVHLLKNSAQLSELTGFKYIILTTSGSSALLMAELLQKLNQEI